ncbi:MAG TPA: efflux RND transporter periplasmic adaptor subunit [Longimicrobium sp.]|nr:efflux RND transporter periplasmic adaptor subunit [Longimicrobium sp.]
MSKSKKIVIAAVLLVAVASGAGIAMARGGDKGALVRTEPVARRDLVSVVTASGKIEPKRKVDISADLSGRVTQVAVEEGQWVERGALLLRIDPTQYQSAVRRAEAAVAQARAREAQARAQLLKAQNDVRRSEMLAQGKELISAQELDQARTQAQVAEAEMQAARFAVQQAQAAVSEARDNLSKTTIVAPMSGRVTRLNIEEGETAVIGTMNNPGSLLLTVADLSVMEAKIKVDETEVPNLGVGDSASVRIDAFPDRVFSGRVTRIGNSAVQTAAAAASGAEQQSVDFEVVITLDAPPAELRPDLSATADVVTDSRRNVLSVPIIALTVRDRDGKKFKQADEGDADAPRSAVRGDARARQAAEVTGVFVVRNGKAEWMPVELGIAGDRYFEIRSGLRGGETVISGTYQAIRDLEDDAAVHTPVDSAAAPAKKTAR